MVPLCEDLSRQGRVTPDKNEMFEMNPHYKTHFNYKPLTSTQKPRTCN